MKGETMSKKDWIDKLNHYPKPKPKLKRCPECKRGWLIQHSYRIGHSIIFTCKCGHQVERGMTKEEKKYHKENQRLMFIYI